MNLVFLTNHVSHYRVSTLVELRRLVDRLTILLSSRDCAPGLPEAGVTVQYLESLKVPRTRRHDNGYVERYEMHFPYGVLSSLRKLDPDCLLAAEFGARTALGTLYCKLHRKPLVVHADLSEEYERGRGAVRKVLRTTLLKGIDRVLVNGRSGARYVESLGYDAGRLVNLPYATDTEHFGRIPHAAPDDGVLRLAYVGQLIERKGLEPFVRRLGKVLAEQPALRVELTLAGSGDQRDALAAIPCPANLAVRMPGQIPYESLGEFYSGIDVFVLPTLSDTWGLVVNESMAGGAPVLGSKQAQAVLELVEEGQQGWVFDATSEDSIEAAIRRCLATPRDEIRRMGESARATALRISPAYSARQIHEACRQAIESRGPRAATTRAL
jgi:glycosyltransferase involved in cell wall biosynthesis